jgi:hypothetical protein
MCCSHFLPDMIPSPATTCRSYLITTRASSLSAAFGTAAAALGWAIHMIATLHAPLGAALVHSTPAAGMLRTV